MTWQLVAMMIITLGASLFVAWPLIFPKTPLEEFFGSEPGEPVLQRLLFQRDTTYAAMKELEFDRAMGNLSDQDFEQLYERYKLRAVALLKRIDDAKSGKGTAGSALADYDDLEPARQAGVDTRPGGGRRTIDLDVEQEIDAYRRDNRAKPAGRQPASRPAPGEPKAKPRACPSCGRLLRDPEATFCSRCGAPLSRKGRQGPGPASRAKNPNGLKGE